MAEVRLDGVLARSGQSLSIRRLGYILKPEASPFATFSAERRAHWAKAAAAEPSLGIRLWVAGDRYPGSSLPALVAAQAASRQGEAASATFHVALFRTFVVENRDISNAAVLEEVARRSGLDGDRFRRDLTDPTVREAVYAEHLEAVDRWGVEAVPTIVVGDQRIEGAAAPAVYEMAVTRFASGT